MSEKFVFKRSVIGSVLIIPIILIQLIIPIILVQLCKTKFPGSTISKQATDLSTTFKTETTCLMILFFFV